MWEAAGRILDRQSFPAVAFLAAIAFLLLSFFDVDFKQQAISPRDEANVAVMILGAIFAATSIGLFLWENEGARFIALRRDRARLVRFNAMCVRVVFGQIQETDVKDAVVLPANEYFDDECLLDRRSALGAFVLAHMPGKLDQIRTEIDHELEGRLVEVVDKTQTERGQSYGVGSAILVENVGGDSGKNMILAAVTTQRAGRGLLAREEFLFTAIRSVNQLCADKRYSEICLPLMGSGHGQLRPRTSLITLLQALASISTSTTIRVATIVVFKKDGDDPAVSEKEVDAIMRTARWLQQA